MIPQISETSPTQALYLDFIKALAHEFEGELSPDYANRTVLATDNSIYQVLPQGVIYPKNTQDLVRIVKLASLEQYHSIVLSPRGGGTGTNGQSLSDGLIIDTSRHMNRILEINPDAGYARVECGVVKDQLNAAIAPHGLFFAPELSTSNRATIGGMINTDASGQGSCAYGKTRDHVLELTTVLLDGSVITTSPIEESEIEAIDKQSRLGHIYETMIDIEHNHKAEIESVFPPLNRCLTGYDLAHMRTACGKIDINSLLCGSEGTLGFIAEAKLNLLKIPRHTALVNIVYDNFDSALRDAKTIMEAGPTSIETIDSKVLSLAQQDIVWHSVAKFFPNNGGAVAGVNLVEYTADREDDLAEKINQLKYQLDKNPGHAIGYTVAWQGDVKKIWAMRKKAVGLLGNMKGEARPVAFVEDTAVPPEKLADFIAEFRALLDQEHLEYGMFGHVDAGVLHVRPILDLKKPEEIKRVRAITDAVVELTHRYGGLLWGEHGKGVRSEYAPKFFGSLYPQLQRIKAVFDPRNQLNPGKIATPSSEIPLLKIDEVRTRGSEDRLISSDSWKNYEEGMFCNGNGACFNWDPDAAMCPSYKATRLRTHSPKGRASLIREWLKQLSVRNVDLNKVQKKSLSDAIFSPIVKLKNTLGKRSGQYDFSHEVYESMAACLACKSCTGQCPIKVDVPEFRSKFLSLYHTRYLRPLKDYFIATVEKTVPLAAKMPRVYNALIGNRVSSFLLSKVAGMDDSPLLSKINFDQACRALGIAEANVISLSKLTDDEKAKAVIIVHDAFTRYFETTFVIDALKLLKTLGFKPMVLPFLPNGKPLHVHGFREKFSKVAKRTAEQLNKISASQIPLVGLEPSMTLAYRGEYKKVLGEDAPEVLLIQEWLSSQTQQLEASQHLFEPRSFGLLAHCTEQSNARGAVDQWPSIFSALGSNADIVETGCCGMAGTFGHETRNKKTSETIYDLSWRPILENKQEKTLVATGFSCRSQAKRFSGIALQHPLSALLAQSKQESI